MKLIAYVPCGYPTLEESLELAGRYAAWGIGALEISLPPSDPYLEAPFIRKRMLRALAECGDYDRYLEQIGRFAREHPHVEILLLLFEEVIRKIGAQRLAVFYHRYGIRYFICVDLKDPALHRVFAENGVKLSRPVRIDLAEEDIARCFGDEVGFVYLQAFPKEGERPAAGMETPAKRIAALRARGLRVPIYCGVGVKTPALAGEIREAGGDGVFLGSALLTLAEEAPSLLAERIEEFRAAAD